MPDKKDEKRKRHEELGKALEATLVSDYVELLASTKKQIFLSFIRGIFTGLGTVIGATIVVSLLIYVLNWFGAVPVIGDYFSGTSDSIERSPVAPK